MRKLLLFGGIVCCLLGTLAERAPAGQTVTISVTANPGTLAPGKSSLIRVRLLDEEGRPYSATTAFVLNVTITTLGDLALAKRTWVREEIREQDELRRISQQRAPGPSPVTSVAWPPPTAKLVTIAGEPDLRRWQLPQSVHAKLADELQTVPHTQRSLLFGRTTEFFLAPLPKGTAEWRFAFAPSFASGTFFVFGEISGKIAGSTVVKLQRAASSQRGSAAWAANAPDTRRPLWFEYVGRLPSETPPAAKYKYNFQLATDRSSTEDCQVDASIEGPMTFLTGHSRPVKILAGETKSVAFLVMSAANADFLEQEQVRINAAPAAGCEMSTASFPFGVPPRFVKSVTFLGGIERAPGNGQIPLQIQAEVKDDLGNTPTPGQYRFDAATMQLDVEVSKGTGSIRLLSDNPVQIRRDDSVQAEWKILGTGDISAGARIKVRAGDGVDQSFPYKRSLTFYFPYYFMFTAPLAGMPFPLLAGRGWLAALGAYILSVVLLIGGFFGAINENKVTKDLVLNVTSMPVWFWPAAVAVCLGVGLVFGGRSPWHYVALGQKSLRSLRDRKHQPRPAPKVP